MIKFSIPNLFRKKRWNVKLYLISAIIGALVGIFILFPMNEIIFFHDQRQYSPSFGGYFWYQLSDSLQGSIPQKTILYSISGSLLGMFTMGVQRLMSKRQQNIQLLSRELTKDIKFLISKGEGTMVEFKSSFRWDLKQTKINRSLEFAVLKTITGFMNGKGGTLLVGVADDGNILGLKMDYQSLKKKDRDGFEQAIVTAVSVNLGTDLCQYIQIVFHAIEGVDICRVIVMRSPRPVYIKHSGSLEFYTRTGGGTRAMNIKEAVDFISNHWPK